MRPQLRDYTPYGHWQTHTAVARLRVHALTATVVFDGPIDNPTFLAYLVRRSSSFPPLLRL